MLQMRRHASVESGSGGRTELLTINKYSRFNNVLEERMVHPSVGHSTAFSRFAQQCTLFLSSSLILFLTFLFRCPFLVKISGGDIRTFKTVRLRDGEHV